MRLKGKVAIVTGAGSGIGRASAVLFAREGAKVVVADWDRKGAEETVRLIRKSRGEAVAVQVDVSKEADCKRMVDTAVKKYGKLDILYNNAGIVKWGAAQETREEDWDKVLAVNLKGPFLGSKYAVPAMIRNKSGSIINTSSIAGLIGFEKIAAYCSSKGGVIELTKSLAVDYAKYKIRANVICPGVIKTAMTKDMLKDKAMQKGLLQNTPIGRLGEPEDIAYAALYLASDESSFVTGSVFVVDGGWTVK